MTSTTVSEYDNSMGEITTDLVPKKEEKLQREGKHNSKSEKTFYSETEAPRDEKTIHHKKMENQKSETLYHPSQNKKTTDRSMAYANWYAKNCLGIVSLFAI